MLADKITLWCLHKLAQSQLLFVCSPSVYSKYEDTHFLAAVTLCCQRWVLLPLFSDSFPDKSCDNMFLVVLAGDNVEEFEQVQDKQNLKNKVTIYLKKKSHNRVKI